MPAVFAIQVSPQLDEMYTRGLKKIEIVWKKKTRSYGISFVRVYFLKVLLS